MSTIARAQVLVFQELSISPAESIEPLRAHISGPNAKLHRYNESDEKALINVGAYDRSNETCYTWPGREAGSIVDEDSVHLFADDAYLLYHEDLIGITAGGRGTVTPVADKNNWVESSAVSYKSNGADYPRSSLFGDRDVQVGDAVYIRGVVDDTDDCTETELWTRVAGFAAVAVDSEIAGCSPDANNAVNTEASLTIEKIGGAENCVAMIENPGGWDYDGLADGDVCETYTVEVVKSSIAGCNAARLRITSASGRDNAAEVEVDGFDVDVAIGDRGLTVHFTLAGATSCSSSASAADVEPNELVVGQKWQIEVCQDFEAVCCEAAGEYVGDADDTYIVEVTKGGLWADEPAISVTTVKGLDFSGPTTVDGPNDAVSIGSNGLTISFVDCLGSSSVSAIGALFAGDSDVAGLRKGDKFYISVESGQNGPIRTIILKHDLPDALLGATDLDLKLFIVKETDFEVAHDRLAEPPLTNWEYESTQLCVKDGITVFDPSWTDDGVEQPLTLYSGTLYIEYREWLADKCNEVGTINDFADIDDIPGQLDSDNPLKWGVFRALQNSNGTTVRYTAVCDPSDLESWGNVLERIDGSDVLYNLVPLTYNREVHNAYQTHVGSESSPEKGNWKAMFVNLRATTAKKIVGLSGADAQILQPTSTDGELTLAVLGDNPEATGTQYTKLRCSSRNGGFITYGVQPGDIVRYLFSVDAFGNEAYTEFVVDTVLSEDSLLLLEGHSAAISIGQKFEIWHTLEKDEIVADLVDQAQSFADRRVVATWPDAAGTAGVAQAGYFVNCALAGLVSAVPPHQALTHVAVEGFDDLAARTKNFFSDTQLDTLAEGGVWIVTEDRDGTPMTRMGLTTDMTDLKTRTEMIRRNLDSMSYLFLRRLRPFIGRTNVTPTMLIKLRSEIDRLIRALKTAGYVPELGAQLIDGEIESLAVHPLAADRVEVTVNLVLPAPMNTVGLHLVI